MSPNKSQVRIGLLPLVLAGMAQPSGASAEEPAFDGTAATVDTVIVTGTRLTGRTAGESATPIDVLSGQQLQATGQTNLLDALKNLLPAMNAQAVGYDFGALARTFQMRGLSPSQTMVLVNGKPRHLSASLYADSDSVSQGSNAVDLDFIPLSAVDRVEVLRDGASAQYGSGAIAGVINVILKSSSEGGSASVLGGGYFDGGGATGQVDVDSGSRFAGGFLHLSAGYRSHDFSNRSGDSGGPEPARVQGDPRSGVGSLAFNLQAPLGAKITGYAFGTVGQRSARAFENPRQPGATGVPAVDALYPSGFTPQENLHETDFGLTAGLKGGDAAVWAWDLSATFGQDDLRLGLDHTVNPVLYGDSGDAQAAFREGSFRSSELSVNFDVRREMQAFGLAKAITIAAGLQQRRESFSIGAGEPGSYVFGGAAGFQGFRPEDQADAARNSWAAYLEVDARPVPAWELSAAVRAERYDGAGHKLAGKLTSRYEIAPGLAVRGSIGNGLHAPSLAQQYYSNTGVAQTQAYVQLAPGSPGAKLLGAPDLRPETARSFTLGLVMSPSSRVHLTVDAYQIDIDDRILNTAQLNNSQLGVDAVQANGIVIPAGVDATNTYVSFFTNGVDTRTRGVDLVLEARSELPGRGSVLWTLGAGYASTVIRRVHPAPGVLSDAGLSLVGPEQRTDLTSAAPRTKVSASAAWKEGRWDATLRETFYGRTSQVQGYGPYYTFETSPAWITSVDLGYGLTASTRLSAGATNLFNRYPAKVPAAVYQGITYNYDQYSHATPYGINGGYWYLRLQTSF